MFVLGACASSKSSTNDGSTIGIGVDVEKMRPPEAALVIREFQKAYGLPPVPPPATPVTSMAQVLEIIRGDRLPEFDAARRFATGRMGPEALTLRAYLDLSYAGALMTAAWILDNERNQDLTELRQVTTARPTRKQRDRRGGPGLRQAAASQDGRPAQGGARAAYLVGGAPALRFRPRRTGDQRRSHGTARVSRQRELLPPARPLARVRSHDAIRLRRRGGPAGSHLSPRHGGVRTIRRPRLAARSSSGKPSRNDPTSSELKPT